MLDSDCGPGMRYELAEADLVSAEGCPKDCGTVEGYGARAKAPPSASAAVKEMLGSMGAGTGTPLGLRMGCNRRCEVFRGGKAWRVGWVEGGDALAATLGHDAAPSES